MTVRTVSNLVLRGVTVGNDGTTVSARLVSGATGWEAPTFSHSMRHPSPGYGLEGAEEQPPYRNASDTGGDAAAPQAGRPGSSAGVPSRRSPASCVGGTVLLGWSSRVEGPQPLRLRQGERIVNLPATRGEKVFQKRHPHTTERPLSLWARGEVEQAGAKPPCGMRMGSTQGIG
jgi:hypothetical protein